MNRVVNGLRVLDLSRLLPGPFAAQMLLHYGAEVIKIEDTGAGDYARDLHPLPASGFGAAFTASNRGKQSLAIDLKQPAGVAAFLALAREADVVLESFRPGVMDRLGVGWEVLHAAAPRLVYCAITGYGQHTRQAALAGHDLNYQGYAGLLHRDGPPAMPTALVADLVGGSMSAVIAIQAALLERERTGQGRFIDLSITHSVMALHALTAAHHFGGADASSARARHGGSHPAYRCYETADQRHVTLAALEPKFWNRFCELAGCPELRGDPTQHDPAKTNTTLNALFRAHTLAEWTRRAEAWDVCIGPVLTPEEALDAAVADGLPLFAHFAHQPNAALGGPGPQREVRVLSGAPADLARPAPSPCPPPPRHGQQGPAGAFAQGLVARQAV